MTVYALAQGTITDREQLARYIEAVGDSIGHHGGTVLALDEAPQNIEGQVEHPRTVIIRFESADDFHAWYDSPEYTAARKLRETAAVGTFILVQGF